jgi:hypothetical protein
MATLDRAVALEQVDAVAVAVGEDLDLDMARMAAGGGPTKVMPARAQASANSAFSDRKP